MNSKHITLSHPSSITIATLTHTLSYPKIPSRLFLINLYNQNPNISINFIQPSQGMYEYSPSNTTQNFYKTATPTSKLWVQSQITAPYVSPNLSFSKEKRFKWASIYWPQNSNLTSRINYKRKSDINEMALKVSKIIDQQQKNQARIKQLKKHFSIGKSHSGSARKDMPSVQSTKKPFKLSKQNERILNKLMDFQKKKQSLLRDRHGNRCNLYDNPEQNSDQQQKQILAKTTGFSTSRKIKLELPHNYFPGPGTYEIPRYLSQLDSKSYSFKDQQEQSSEKTSK